jgi:nitrile hydratase subunit beta
MSTQPDPSNPAPHRGYHDIGGLPGDVIDQSEHVLEPWEKRVDAMRMLLGDDKRKLLRADGLRNAIETMGEDIYLELGYYERWMAAVIKVLTERGVLERDEIDARIAAVQARLGIDSVTPRPMPAAPDSKGQQQ